MPAITDSGRPNRRLWLIVETSRVTRVTRSPELAASTRPNGRPSTVRTTYSRASASTSWPNSTDIRSARKVISAWTTITPATARASPFMVAASVAGAAARSTSSPSSRGTTRPDSAARACRISRATTANRRVRTIRRKNVQTAWRLATGNPRSGRRDDAKYSTARRSRSRCRPRHALSRNRSEPSRGGSSASGTRGGGGVLRQVSAELRRPVCSSVIVHPPRHRGRGPPPSGTRRCPAAAPHGSRTPPRSCRTAGPPDRRDATATARWS